VSHAVGKVWLGDNCGRHIFHASTFEEATELLLRWSVEGLGNKLGGELWMTLAVGSKS